MHRPDEIHESSAKTSGRVQVRENERKMARQLVRQLAGELRPKEFEDGYHKALKAAVRRKVQGKDIVVPEGREEAPAVADLMDALKRSVEAVRTGKDPRALRKAASSDDIARLSRAISSSSPPSSTSPAGRGWTSAKLVRAIENARGKAA